MEIRVIWRQARAIAIECMDGCIYHSESNRRIYLDHKLYMETKKNVVVIYGLTPSRKYTVSVMQENQEEASVNFTTLKETFSFNVRDFGAKGDGIQDDTLFIQAAINICPKEGRILIPEGTYKISGLFLKDNIRIELQKGAVLSAFTQRNKFPVFKAVYHNYDNSKEMILGTWEGDAMDMFSGIITGVGVKNVVIYGEGIVDGNASGDNWWNNPKEIKIAARPRLLFLNGCENIEVCGITFRNSPSWNVHPFFSKHLKFISLSIEGPKDSPNTDGLNPEACDDVEICGCHFSVGDDCIAVKSGKISIGAKYKTPSSNIMIHQCCMQDGHGSITLGSEMAGGIKNLTAKQCLFLRTDRGLRVKSRRGRGKDAIIDGIVFEDIKMDSVLTPFVINCFYHCDIDGHTEYVQNKNPLPVDDRTPSIKTLSFRHVQADNCHYAAAFFYGLPEQKIEYIEMKHIYVNYAANALSGQPAMMDGIDTDICKMGIFIKNVDTLVLEDIHVFGQEGDDIYIEGINHFVK